VTRALRLAVSQAVVEQRSFWRSMEYALFTLAFPLMILLLIGAANVGSASTVITAVLISGCLGLTGWLAFGAAPRPSGLLELAGGICVGIVCFAGLGLAISSVITSAESAGPLTYATFLPIAIISGVFDPTFSGLPGWLSRAVALFPVKALAQVLQSAYVIRPWPALDLVNLAAWTAVGGGIAIWRFRWHG
jgi:ABC-2 type transport system permease protein